VVGSTCQIALTIKPQLNSNQPMLAVVTWGNPHPAGIWAGNAGKG